MLSSTIDTMQDIKIEREKKDELVAHIEELVSVEPEDTYPACPKRLFIHGTSEPNFKGITNSGEFIPKYAKFNIKRENDPNFTTDILQSLIHGNKHASEQPNTAQVITLWKADTGNIVPNLDRHSYNVDGRLTTDEMLGSLVLDHAAADELQTLLTIQLENNYTLGNVEFHDIEAFLQDKVDANLLTIEALSAKELAESLIRGTYENLLTSQFRSAFIMQRNIYARNRDIPLVTQKQLVIETMDVLNMLDVQAVPDLQKYKEWALSKLVQLDTWLKGDEA